MESPSALVPTRAEEARGLNAPRPSRDIHKQKCESCIVTCAGYSAWQVLGLGSSMRAPGTQSVCSSGPA